MNLKLTFIAFLLTLTYSCKKENSFNNFKYADQPETAVCQGLNAKLYKEALYSFEDDILKHYSKNKPNTTLAQAYNQFIRTFNYNNLKFEDIVSTHTVEVFNALKNEDGLWDANNPKSYLNYNSDILNCIENNIKDPKVKTTFKALKSTNSLAPKLFGATLTSKHRSLIDDKTLATYVALDLYYAKLFDADLSKVNLEKPQEKVDFNKVPK